LNLAVRRLLLLTLFGACLAGLGGPVGARSLAGGLAVANAGEGSEVGKGRWYELFKVINFVLLAGGLAYVLRKPLADFFSARSASIRKSLEEGRKALEASQAQLQAVEEKLQRLEEEIAAFKASAAREMEAERQRLRQAAADEAEKILESARAQMDAATRAAKIELRIYAAQQAVQLAEELVRQRLDDASLGRLVSQFIATFDRRQPKVES
jgi:F-type H+-transporting ATPase subunit b